VFRIIDGSTRLYEYHGFTCAVLIACVELSDEISMSSTLRERDFGHTLHRRWIPKVKWFILKLGTRMLATQAPRYEINFSNISMVRVV
jgi:hypothetical protein